MTARNDPDAAPAMALDLDGVGFRYGAKTVLDQVSLGVPFGRMTILLGPNGAGKSTLIALLTRMIAPAAGAIAIAGRDLGRWRHVALEPLGVVFQEPTLDPDLSVMSNLVFAAALHGLPWRTAHERALAELARIGLAERRDDKVRTLNGGHRRRVEIARALIHEPAILIADETTAGLDIPTRAAVLEHVRGLISARGLAVLWATHLIDEVRTGDRLVILDRGRVRAQGEVPDILAATGTTSLAAAFGHLTATAAP